MILKMVDGPHAGESFELPWALDHFESYDILCPETKHHYILVEGSQTETETHYSWVSPS